MHPQSFVLVVSVTPRSVSVAATVASFMRRAAGIRNRAYDAGSYLLTKRRLKNPNDSHQQQKDNPNPHRLSHHKPPERRSTSSTGVVVERHWVLAI